SFNVDSLDGKPRLEQRSISRANRSPVNLLKWARTMTRSSISFRRTFRNLESERGSGETSQIDISHQSRHSEPILFWQSERRRERIKCKGDQAQALDRYVP